MIVLSRLSFLCPTSLALACGFCASDDYTGGSQFHRWQFVSAFHPVPLAVGLEIHLLLEG